MTTPAKRSLSEPDSLSFASLALTWRTGDVASYIDYGMHTATVGLATEAAIGDHCCLRQPGSITTSRTLILCAVRIRDTPLNREFRVQRILAQGRRRGELVNVQRILARVGGRVG
jgi:hypothetical protein